MANGRVETKWSELPPNGENMWILDAVLKQVKPCKTLEEEERDEDLKDRTPHKFQILKIVEEQIKEQEFLEGQRIAREERLKREKLFGKGLFEMFIVNLDETSYKERVKTINIISYKISPTKVFFFRPIPHTNFTL